MKKSLIYLLTILLMLFISSCSSDDDGPTDPTDGTSATQYYPGGVGSTFNYQGQTTDSSGTSNYTRDVSFSSQLNIGNTTYIIQNNNVNIGTATFSAEFPFRTSNTGMFIYIDTAVFDELLDSLGIDPSLVTIIADQEVRLISYPFNTTPQWNAYTVKVTAFGGLISLNILELQGNYKGQEQLTIMGQSMTAEKVEYIATVKIPESLEDIANPPTVTLSAMAWFVKDVGLVKLDGSGVIIAAFTGGGLEFDDDASTATETLVAYDIK